MASPTAPEPFYGSPGLHTTLMEPLCNHTQEPLHATRNPIQQISSSPGTLSNNRSMPLSGSNQTPWLSAAEHKAWKVNEGSLRRTTMLFRQVPSRFRSQQPKRVPPRCPVNKMKRKKGWELVRYLWTSYFAPSKIRMVHSAASPSFPARVECCRRLRAHFCRLRDASCPITWTVQTLLGRF